MSTPIVTRHVMWGCMHDLILFFLPRVDKDRSGVISDSELQQALSNGKYLGPFCFYSLFTCSVTPSFSLLLFNLFFSSSTLFYLIFQIFFFTFSLFFDCGIGRKWCGILFLSCRKWTKKNQELFLSQERCK